MTKEKKLKKTASEQDELDYKLTDFDYDSPEQDEKYKEEEDVYEIDYDSSNDFDDD
jgi:hypothetical protein